MNTRAHYRSTHTTTILWIWLLSFCLLGSCAREHLVRLPRSVDQLKQERQADDVLITQQNRLVLNLLLQRTRAEYDRHLAGQAPSPVIDVLIVSGGGDWGAFGAGFLKGWGRVPPGPMARPEFDVVTGVSTGALIAPFAFLGTDHAIDQIVDLYRNPQRNWVRKQGAFFFLPGNLSFTKIRGLEQEIDRVVDLKMLEQIVESGKDGRLLAVNTTNIDYPDGRPWDLVQEARTCLQAGDPTHVRRILLASSAIPGAFPPRLIDNKLFVDGAVTGNILYGGRIREEDSLPALWSRAYPALPVPKIRYWLIFNNSFRPPPVVTQPRWPAVVDRSLGMATRTSTINAIRHLFAQAEISKLKRGATVEVRIVSVPDDYAPPKPGIFVKETMNALADLGERMGADPSSWRTEEP